MSELKRFTAQEISEEIKGLREKVEDFPDIKMRANGILLHADMLEYLTDELNHAKEMLADYRRQAVKEALAGQWQDISTAPNMEHVLLYFPKGGHVIALMLKEGDFDTVGYMGDDKPTHWMPLPEPPKDVTP